MRFESALNNGRIVAARVVEITTVPLIDASDVTDVGFTHLCDGITSMLSDCTQRFHDGSFALELLLASVPVANQLFKAQPRIFLILRKLGSNREAVLSDLNEIARDVYSQLAALGYSCVLLDGDNEPLAEDFSRVLDGIRHESVVAISRQEKVMGGPMGRTLYYNEPVAVNHRFNLGLLTNELASRPWSAYSLQMIPTAYADVERQSMERNRMTVDLMRKQVMRTPGSVTPTAYIEAAQSYLDFIDHENEMAFIFMPVVYSAAGDAKSLMGRLLALFTPSGGDTHMLSLVPIADSVPGLGRSFLTKPWTVSDILVTRKRNMRFWGDARAPRELIRCKQLLPFSSAVALLRPPYDDGATTVGLEITRNGTAKERLDDSVLDAGSFRIGQIVDPTYVDINGDEPQQAGIPLRDLTKHGMIVGKSGSGKTNFIHTMLIRLARLGIPFLAIEPTKREYRCLTDAIDDLVVFTPGVNGVSPFIINPFIPPVGVTVESYIPSLMNAFQTAFTMPDPLPAIFQEVVNKTYTKYGWKRTSTCEDPDVTPFGFHEMILEFKQHVDAMNYQGETRGNINTAGVVRLSTLIEQNPNLYDTTATIPVHELLTKHVVLELNAISSDEQKTLLMALLLISICLYTKFNTALGGDLKNLLFIDEAHALFNSGGENGNRAAKELENMIAEIRAYGTGVFLGDQSATTFGDSIMANTDTKIMFQIVEAHNKQVLADATGMDERKTKLLSQLHVGECLLYYGRLPEPILVKADDAQSVARFRRNVGDGEIRSRDTFWKTHRDLLMPFGSCALCAVCRQSGCDLARRENADYFARKMSYFYMGKLTTRETLIAFYNKRINGVVARYLDANGITDDRQRLGFCVATRLLRYLLRGGDIRLSASEISALNKRCAQYSFASPPAAAPEGATDNDVGAEAVNTLDGTATSAGSGNSPVAQHQSS